MFRVTSMFQRSSFTMFLIQNKGNPKLAGLAVPARGKLLGKWYRELPKAELATLKAAAVTGKLPAAAKVAAVKGKAAKGKTAKKK